MGYFDGAIQARDESESLEHHGILGQKWGVRRFQNKDGSLNEKGKRRYQNPDGTLTALGKRVSKKYKKESDAMALELASQRQKSMVNAYNKAAIEENRKIDEAIKRGEDKTMTVDAWNKKWDDSMSKTYDKYYLEEIASIANNSKHQKAMKKLVKKYGMLEWDALAKTNANDVKLMKERNVDELRRLANS